MKEPDRSRVEIDLRHRETEAGWQHVIDAFALAAVPKWFEWLGWVLVLSAFQFVANESAHPAARVIPRVCGALLFLYFNAFFFRLHFKGWPGITSPRVERTVSIVVSGALSAACWASATFIARLVAGYSR